ncbi:histidinol-phosphate transaminase [Saccharospirillum salsuginis]|uniref:Histidinol-phosphate aminotransferase n=1 Tax=Saccharospirillum salsuginis TaxID=418750 RepID=A0A918KGK7_9GAMM|nr:histidinol-phosphate transaminase [Saccharospirillum salsuginis]GGX60785.1 histidinol-phosphate aminotransferase 2 [Saccharospirillum salsuginis]
MSCDYIALAVPGVQELSPYVPGKPTDELKRELGVEDVIKLASNENPLGLSPRVQEAIEGTLADLSRYPDGSGYRLKEALATRHSIDAEQITLGCGSNELFELVARAYLQPGMEAVMSEYAFAVYPLVVQAAGAKAVVTPARNWGHDLDAMAEAINERTRVVFIANPNNPTGTWISKGELKAFLKFVPEHVLVVLDEAYAEYVDQDNYPSGIKLQRKYPNLIVTRTFSKAYGLAGLRIGFGVSHPQVADVLNRVRQPFNVTSPALAAAEAALGDQAFLESSLSLNERGREQLNEAFDRLGLDTIPSVTNFITFKVGSSEKTAALHNGLLKSGIIVRPLASYGMPKHLRVSIGLEAENKRFIESLERELVFL